MGKRRFATISAAVTRPEPQNTWMRDLQLRTIAVDTTRWQSTRQPTLWCAFSAPARTPG